MATKKNVDKAEVENTPLNYQDDKERLPEISKPVGLRNSGTIVDEIEQEHYDTEESNDESRTTSEDYSQVSSCYGEPIKIQKIRIDFTPQAGVDDDKSIIQKCIDFWTMIENHKEIHNLKIWPEKYTESPMSSSGSRAESSTTSQQSDNYMNYPSINKLNWIQQQGVLTTALETKCEKQLSYEVDSAVNCTDVPPRKEIESTKSSVDPLKNSSSTYSNLMKQYLHSGVKAVNAKNKAVARMISEVRSQRAQDVSKMCAEMEYWDITHPKTLEPPGQPPGTIKRGNCI